MVVVVATQVFLGIHLDPWGFMIQIDGTCIFSQRGWGNQPPTRMDASAWKHRGFDLSVCFLPLA